MDFLEKFFGKTQIGEKSRTKSKVESLQSLCNLVISLFWRPNETIDPYSDKLFLRHIIELLLIGRFPDFLRAFATVMRSKYFPGLNES